MTNAIFIIAHTPLASALRQCVAHVFADRLSDVLALDIQPQVSLPDSLSQARQLLRPLGEVPVLLLTDVMGATPCNVARQLLAERPARLLTGVNLPMVWRAMAYQHASLDELVVKALAGGSQGVMQVSAEIESFTGKKSGTPA